MDMEGRWAHTAAGLSRVFLERASQSVKGLVNVRVVVAVVFKVVAFLEVDEIMERIVRYSKNIVALP